MRGRWAQQGGGAIGMAMLLGISPFWEPAVAGPAIGQFEVKSLEAEPGEIEFQSQNAYAFGAPLRRIVQEPGGDLEGDHNSQARARNALELEFGLTRSLKTRIGIEYEAERREEFSTRDEADGYDDLKLDEYEAEVIWVAIPREGNGFGLGVVVEYELPSERESPHKLIAGPIVEWAQGPWQLTLIPMLVQFLGGERNDQGQRDEKIDFAYASALKYHWSDAFDLALEAYGTVERVGGRGGRSEEAALFGDFDQHRLGPVAYWNFDTGIGADGQKEGAEVSLGVGALFGLNDDTPSATLKLSMEVVY